MKFKTAAIMSMCLAVSLVSAAFSSSSNASPRVAVKAGGACSKVGSLTTIAKVAYNCTKNAKTKKLTWVKVKAGDPCSKVGSSTTIAKFAYICTKNAKTKKLTWVKKVAPVAVIHSSPAGTISPEWVRWDSTACKFVTATQHPAKYVAELRKAPGLKLAMGSQSETVAQSRLASDSVRTAAKAAGINLIVGDYNYPSTTDPLVQAQTMALQKPAGLISYMVLTSLIQPINENFAKICAPVMQITVPYENDPTFGLDDVTDGALMGGMLGDWAKNKHWSGPTTSIVESFNASYGASVTARLDQCANSALAGAPGATIDKFDVGTQTLDGQVAMTNWLTAHPNIHQILVCAQSDPYAIAMAEAFSASGRIPDGAVVGTGGVMVTSALLKTNTALVGTVDQAYGEYGYYVIPMMQDILAGKPVPLKVHQLLKTITRALP